ncbi:MAG TPA: ImmA/IrrE family metallo-endopeptidase [Pyrinomonadaceae bacterium]|nr:ImmA/IrrE family metallo-endopeptidase [Pyrinomonadaceae bacterium]
MIRVEIKPKLVTWARERANYDREALTNRFPKLVAWEQGNVKPTLKQVEAFASATHTPVGFLFLPEPPIERIPIPDLRTMRTRPFSRPSPDLLDMIYVCQQRQEWYRDFARSDRLSALPFVGSATLKSNVESTAASMRQALKFDLDERRQLPTWTDALRRFIEQADDMGIMVMCSGVVLNNNSRRLDPDEFRGFALADDLAPLVFINGADTKAAQMFTLAHELAHIWLGQSAVSDAEPSHVSEHEVERWCNKVAAELLVPMANLRGELPRFRTWKPNSTVSPNSSKSARW